ncbi:MAG: hypothetical protein KF772_04665 [Cryobacterium sp.]|nr:hypothetical protein [Cryobacterium sp.]
MTNTLSPEEFLAACSIEPAVLELRPDYRAMLIVVDGLSPSLATNEIEQLLRAAEEHARTLLVSTPVAELPHVAAWRETFRAFGARPQHTRNSLEALTRRAQQELPRVNALTDIYNAISVLHQIPFGGEDFANYDGPARLVRASGEEDFDTVADGVAAIEHPEPGEVVWRDDTGVTCRRWNWRQCRRTALSDSTRTALFILDILDPISDSEVEAAADALETELGRLGEISARRRLIRASA